MLYEANRSKKKQKQSVSYKKQKRRMDDDMHKNYEYSGTFTTLQEEETRDIFYDIANVLMKGFTYEFNDKRYIEYTR